MENNEKNTKSNIFILHSLNADTVEFWGKTLKEHFESNGVFVAMPDFPIRAESSFQKFDQILTEYLGDKSLNENSIVVAHSIGNPYFLKFCKKHNFVPKIYIAVAPRAIYGNSYGRTDYMTDVVKQSKVKEDEFDYAKNNLKIIFLHSDEEMGDMQEFDWFERDTNAKKIYLKGYNHFDGGHQVYDIPELTKLIESLL